MRHHLIAAALFAAVPGTVRAAPVVFDFETLAVDATTPLTLASAGLSATFAGPPGVDPGAFGAGFNSSSGPFGAPYRTLVDAFLTVGPAFGAPGSPLTIAFSAPLTAFSVQFALDDRANRTAVTLSTNTGGTASANGVLSGGFLYPEGTLSFSGGAFTSVTLSTGAPDFQIDNVLATPAPAPVPEPASLALLGAGLAAAAAVRRRVRR